MTMGNTEELLSGLRDGTFHFALIEGFFPREEFASRIYSTEEFIPVCAAGHVFSRQLARIQDLLSEPLLLREPGSGTRNILEKALDINNISLSSFSRITEINSMYAIVQLLLEDCGISFLYKTAVLPYLASERCVRFLWKISACSTTFPFSGRPIRSLPGSMRRFLLS